MQLSRHRLMDIHIVLKKGTTYALLILLLFVPSFLLALLFQKIVYGDIHYLFLGFLLLLLLLVTIVFNRIKPQTEKAVEQFLFKDRMITVKPWRNSAKRWSQSSIYNPFQKVSSKQSLRPWGLRRHLLFLWNEEKEAILYLNQRTSM